MYNKIDKVPEEFKQLAEDFSKNGFITTSLDNLINWSRSVRVKTCLSLDVSILNRRLMIVFDDLTIIQTTIRNMDLIITRMYVKKYKIPVGFIRKSTFGRNSPNIRTNNVVISVQRKILMDSSGIRFM